MVCILTSHMLSTISFSLQIQCVPSIPMLNTRMKAEYMIFNSKMHIIITYTFNNIYFVTNKCEVVIVWYLDLQHAMQSVPVTTKVVSSNLVHGEVFSIQQYVMKYVNDLQ